MFVFEIFGASKPRWEVCCQSKDLVSSNHPTRCENREIRVFYGRVFPEVLERFEKKWELERTKPCHRNAQR